MLGSARFFVEYQQLEQRIRLDVPTLADPVVRDLLHESDLFARSFSGGGFGLLSPLDFVHILSLTTEIISHILLIASLTRGAAHFGVLFLSMCSALLPFLVMWCRCPPREADPPYNVREARAANRQERMRNLAYSDVHRAEIALFGLRDWILESWSAAHNIVSSSERPQSLQDSVLSRLNMSDFMFALQNVRLAFVYYTRLAQVLTYQLDTSCSGHANFVYAFRFFNLVSQLSPVRGLCMSKFDHDNEDGFSWHIPDVCILCEHEIEAKVAT